MKKHVVRLVGNTFLVLFLVGIILTPPVFSSLVFLSPLDSVYVSIPTFEVAQPDPTTRPHIRFGEVEKGTRWKIPVTYTVQFARKMREEKVLQVTNTAQENIKITLTSQGSGILPSFSRAQGEEERERILSPGERMFVDLLIDARGTKKERLEALIVIEAFHTR